MPARLRIMTFNVRYDEEADGPHAWPYRRDAAVAMIREHEVDLVALQEPLPNQWRDIGEGLSGYAPFGFARDEQDNVQPYGGFVRAERFDVLESGVFWLSETPAVAQSISWGNDS